MDYTIIIWSAGSVALLGLLLGIILAVASKYLRIKQDSRVLRIREALPGANCGNCGFAGCGAFAEAIVKDGVPINLCTVADEATLRNIGEVMGISDIKVVPLTAVVHCQGEEGNAHLRYRYQGLNDCAAEAVLADGGWSCPFSCIGLGNCVRVCPTHAIHVENGLARVDRDRCIACGKCVAACPRGIIKLEHKDAAVTVRCSNALMGKAVREACKVGCIGCGLCAKNCKFDAIRMEDNLPVIDPEKCTGCLACVKVCPRDVIGSNLGMPRVAYIREEKCIGCTRCAKVCKFDAVKGELKSVHEIDPDKCTGCGVCVASCPKDAIELIGK